MPRVVRAARDERDARDARNAANPVGAICAWMKSFCKAAKVQGVADAVVEKGQPTILTSTSMCLKYGR